MAEPVSISSKEPGEIQPQPLPTGGFGEKAVQQPEAQGKRAWQTWKRILNSRWSSSILLSNFGTWLKQCIIDSPHQLGKFAQNLCQLHELQDPGARRKLGGKVAKDLLPLPFMLYSAEELEKEEPFKFKLQAGKFKDKKFEGTLEKSWHDWIFLHVLLVNYLHEGGPAVVLKDRVSGSPTAAQARPSTAQARALRGIHFRCLDLALADVPIPDTKWDEIAGNARLSYQGEVVQKAVELTLDAVIPALPPAALSGGCKAVDLARGYLKKQLVDPSLSIKPRHMWPEKLKKAQVRASQAEWDKIAAECWKRKIFTVVEESELIWHNGELLAAGAFGVKKGKQVWSEERQKMVEVLRLIINMTPSNELQNPITGDVRTLPTIGQWMMIEIGSDEYLAWSSEDMKCCFYIFELPRCWIPYFVLGRMVDGALCGCPGRKVHLAVRVLPMGWLSAVGICQSLHREILLRSRPGGAALPRAMELRKDKPAPGAHGDRLQHFFQSYIDNWDEGKALPLKFDEQGRPLAASRPAGPSQWQSQVRAAYQATGAARADDKSVEQGIEGCTLGGVIDGVIGKAGPSHKRLAELISISCWLLRKTVANRMVASMGAGKWVFALQFRRQLMVIMDSIWLITSGSQRSWSQLCTVEEELLLLCAGVGFLSIDMRAEASEIVTVSDASESGGGSCRSVGLTDLGREALAYLTTSSQGPGRDEVVLIESFGGIGGARRAVDLLGVEIALHIHLEQDGAARKVSHAAWPDGHQFDDVKALDESQFEQLIADHPRITVALQVGGPPCQDVSGLNAGNVGASGPRSGLRLEMVRIQKVIKKILPEAFSGQLLECVASMSRDSQALYDKQCQVVPLRICASDISACRRPRLYWPSYPLVKTDDALFAQEDRWTSVKLIGKKLPVARWCPRGWRPTTEKVCLPTFVRAIKRVKPPWKPAGLQGCDPDTVARWEKHNFRYPPYQYKPQYQLSDGKGNLKSVGAESREIIMGFPRDHTRMCWTTAEQRQNQVGWEDARCSLVGNTFSVPVVSWLLAHFFVAAGVLEKVPPVSTLVAKAQDTQHQKTEIEANGAEDGAAMPHHPSCRCAGCIWRYGEDKHQKAGNHARDARPKDRRAVALVRRLLLNQSHRGGEVLGLRGPTFAKTAMRSSIDAGFWAWKVIVKNSWKHAEHINTLEARAYCGSLRWRARSVKLHGQRFLHLVDSAVTLSVMVKGRTSSKRMRRPVLKAAALILAAEFVPCLGHVRTHRNPADKPSRAGPPSKRARRHG